MHHPEGPVAQWLEPAAHNRLVGGSSPSGPTINDRLHLVADCPIEERLQELQRLGGRVDGTLRFIRPASMDDWQTFLNLSSSALTQVATENHVFVFPRHLRVALKRLGPIFGLNQPADRAELRLRKQDGFLNRVSSQLSIVALGRRAGGAASLGRIGGGYAMYRHAGQMEMKTRVAVLIDIP